jgi:putative FmdB family regulatory protein
MATYDFTCRDHGVTTIQVPMSQVSPTLPCPTCGAEARRVFSAPRLSLGDSTSRRLIEATARTAHEPAVVSALPGRPFGPGRRRPVTADPRTAKLPRP